MLDLRLFHHYMTNTSMTFDIDDRFSDHWKDQIVKESLQHEFLMDSILSLSAFHVAYEEADVASVYVSYALEYQNRAFAAFNEALAKATRDNAGALFSFSMFMVICALVPSNKIGGQSTSEKLLSLSRYVRGTKAVAETFQEWLRDGSFGAFLNGRWSSIVYSHPDLEDDLKHLRHLSNVLGLAEATYEEPVNRLEVAFARGEGSAIAWWAEIPDEFMEAIRRGDPLALLILMHWGALLHQLRHFWWVGNSGEMLVNELYQRLVDLGAVWRKSAEQVSDRLRSQEASCQEGSSTGESLLPSNAPAGV